MSFDGGVSPSHPAIGPDETPIPLTHRHVVDSAWAAAAWRGSIVTGLRRPVLPVLIAGSLLLPFLLYYAGFDSRYSLVTRVTWAIIWAVVTVFVIWTPLFALGYWMTKRNARQIWYDGAVRESGFGADAFVTRNPYITRRIRYDAVKSIDVRGNYVYIRVLGGAVPLTYPRALFPDGEIARIRKYVGKTA
jgi:hypothetical protein